MKIRNDFVSNSSSCSFVLNDCVKGLKELRSLGNIPYKLFETYSDGGLRLYIHFKYKDIKEFYEKIVGEEYNGKDYYYDWNGKKVKVDPESDQDIDCNDSGLNVIYELIENNDPIINKITFISFSVDDHNDLAVAFLFLIYKYFESKKLSVSDEYSELSFKTESETLKFLINLVRSLKDCDLDLIKEGIKNG